ncbi:MULTISPECIES: hypothetical protein [unclassified Xanthomonas]|uniref:hypothetical protein n=1 Tax=unclassified Xanthomonas TaxID=2643310 RepID=UPI00216A2145|nr:MULTISPECIES: hypothetical protein [unclassified Xanthomonas]MCS3748301.1 hypothetical protein [Xanthomonas sp. 3793]MCS3809676.1 hypothetical protein [Xanthomonas sp. 4461]
MKILNSLMDKLDSISSLTMLCINSVLCVFVLLAHGGALLLVRTGKVPEMAQEVAIAYVSIPAVIVSLAFSALALIRREKLVAALKVHAVMLMGLAAYTLYVGLDVVFNGVPSGSRFSWDPTLFAVFLGYPFLLIKRAFPWSGFSRAPLRFAPVLAVGISFLISIAVSWRMFALFRASVE